MNIEHIAQTLGLKKYGSEYKGPCPICGGDDRFWIKRGIKFPAIFGCRAQCHFSDIMKEMEYRGLVENEHLSPQAIHQFKKESPVPVQLWLWAMEIVEIVAKEGCFEDEDVDCLKDAIKTLDRAKRNGWANLSNDYVWEIAQIRERGLIHENI